MSSSSIVLIFVEETSGHATPSAVAVHGLSPILWTSAGNGVNDKVFIYALQNMSAKTVKVFVNMSASETYFIEGLDATGVSGIQTGNCGGESSTGGTALNCTGAPVTKKSNETVFSGYAMSGGSGPGMYTEGAGQTRISLLTSGSSAGDTDDLAIPKLRAFATYLNTTISTNFASDGIALYPSQGGGGSSPGSRTLWVSQGGYDPADARAIFSNAPCVSGSGSTCVPTRSVYLTWSQPREVFLAPISNISAVAVSSIGTSLVAGVTAGSTTSALVSSNGGGSWTTLGTVSGKVTSVSATPQIVLLSTISSGNLMAATFSTSGGEIGAPSLGTAGAYQNSTATWVATNYGYEAAIVASQTGTGTLQLFTSSNGGATFSAGATIGGANLTAPSPAFDSIGETMLVPPGGLPGQVSLATVGTELFLFYTTRVEGRVIGATLISSDAGTYWEGPYPAEIPGGSVMDPTTAVTPAGQVEVAWREDGNSSWEVEQALFSPGGQMLGSAGAIPGSGGNSETPLNSGPPSLGVDWLGRPIDAWVSTNPAATPLIQYSGEFPSTSSVLGYLSSLVNDPLLNGDTMPRSGGSGGSQLNSFTGIMNRSLGNISNDTHPHTPNLPGAQNLSILQFSPNVTQYPIKVATSGAPARPQEHQFDPALGGRFCAELLPSYFRRNTPKF